MLSVTIPLAAALMVVLPLALAWIVVRRLGTPARLLFWGAATFVAAQALRLPLLEGLTHLFASGALPAPPAAYHAAFNIAVLSLTAGLFEETARYLAYRFAIPDARSWNAAVTYGAGHGGSEAILLGGLMAVGFAGMVALGVPAPGTPPDLDPQAQAALAAQVAHYWASPWYVPLLGVAERAFSLCFHMAMAVVVLEAVTRRNLAWLGAAVAAHAAANAAGAAALIRYGPVAAEIVIGLIAAIAVYVLAARRRAERPGVA